MISIIYEDDYLLVVDKPSGLLTIPTPKKENNTLTDILNRDMAQPNVRLYPCHRLDRETSGLIIFAKTKKIQQLMMLCFQHQEVKKEYTAFVNGWLTKTSGTMRSYISDHPSQPKKLAVTSYKLLRQYRDFAQVLVMPQTGRTNQIRIQFKQIGHPLLGESRFAFRRDFKVKFKRVALHASRLIFPHPITDKQIHLYCELPADLQNLLG